MAELPTDRVTPEKPPFTFVGVDCFGPFVVHRNTQDGYAQRVTVQTKGSMLPQPIDKIVFLESAN